MIIRSFVYLVVVLFVVFFFKQKTAYEMRISDWISDVCSSDRVVQRLARARDIRMGTLSFRLARVHARRRLRHRAEPDAYQKSHIAPRSDRAAEIGSASCRARVCQYV